MTEDVIKGKVIKIVNKYQVLVNVGYSHGVKKDMKFIIYSEGQEIKDPDTKKSLGKVEILKSRIEPTHIQEKFSTMETYEKEVTSLARAMIFSRDVAETQKPLPLPYETEDDIFEQDKYIRVGDLVRQDLA